MATPSLVKVESAPPSHTADTAIFPEAGISLPWGVNPVASWVDYRCWVEVALDAGMALHKPLPQTAQPVDTLASVGINDANLDSVIKPLGGVNMVSGFRGADVIQRMATSTYRFILRGWGVRAGYQIPIPGIVAIGNSPVTPERIQRAGNVIVGNFAGIPIWLAFWEIHYIVAFPPQGSQAQAPIPTNVAQHITPDAKLPATVKLPWTQPDQRNQPGRPNAPPVGIPALPRRQ